MEFEFSPKHARDARVAFTDFEFSMRR